MRERKRVLSLILIMATASLLVTGVTISMLYGVAYEEERARLVETAQSQARLIEAVARFDAIYSKDYPEGSLAATLSQVTDAHEHYKGFGKTGEFTLARREGNYIVFLLSHRHYDLEHPKPVPFASELAEPMRRALSGLSGTVVGYDYRDEFVLAAHEPVADLDLGIVAKIDLDEVRAPFIRAGLIAVCFAVLVVFAGAGLFLRISRPMLKRLEAHTTELGRAIEKLNQEIGERKRTEETLRESEEKYRNLFEHASDSIFIIDPSTHRFLDVNENAAKRLGYIREELLQFMFDDIDTPMAAQRNEAIVRELLNTGQVTFEHVHLRKDGTKMPVEISSRVLEYGGRQVFQSIARDITERKQTEEELQKKTHDLGERIKELNCLYEISHLREAPGISLEEMLQGVVDLLPPSWQFPEITCSRIVLEGEEYKTVNFKETRWKQTSDILVHGKPVGSVEVCYLKERPESDEGPFLKEERNLINAVAERVGKAIQHMGAEEALSWEAGVNAAIATLSKALLSPTSIEDISYLVLEEAKRLTESGLGFVGYIDPETGYLVCPTLTRDVWEGCQVPDKDIIFKKFRGLWGWVLENKEPLLTNNPLEDPRSTGVPQGHLPIYGFLSTPAMIGETLVGQIALANADRDYTDRDLRLIERLADIFAFAIQRKLAEEALQEAHDELEIRVEVRTAELRRLSVQLLNAQEEERKRIALELHDGIGQNLSAIKYRVENALEEMRQRMPANEVKSLEPVVSVVQDAVEEVRRISMNLRPSILDDLGILATVSWFCREVEETFSGIRIEKRINIDENDVPDSLKIVIYRLLQEALNNMAKHSQADHVHLVLEGIDENIELTVMDNGVGFDMEQVLSEETSKRGLGLASMKERAELSGGSFLVESQRGVGTTVRASWSLGEMELGGTSQEI